MLRSTSTSFGELLVDFTVKENGDSDDGSLRRVQTWTVELTLLSSM